MTCNFMSFLCSAIKKVAGFRLYPAKCNTMRGTLPIFRLSYVQRECKLLFIFSY